MLVTKRIEIRLYPNKAQANFINKMVGATRVVYNSIHKMTKAKKKFLR